MTEEEASGAWPPLRIHLNWPLPTATPAGPDWKEPAKYQRDIAKWIIGGVMATVIAILAGSSLTKLGSLDFTNDPLRLSLALGGAFVGLVGIGWFLHLALQVLLVEAGSVDNLADGNGAEWAAITARVNSLFAYDLKDSEGKNRNVEALLAARHASTLAEDDLATLRRINSALGFLFIQQRYKRMIDNLPLVGMAAIIGLGLYAWAANPGEKRPPERPGLSLKLTR